MASTIASGARAIFKIAGKKVAFATGVTVNETIGFEPFRPLDSLAVIENIEVTYDCSMSADLVVSIGSDPTQAGLFPKVDLLSILNESELVAEIIDAVTSQLLLVVEGVKVSGNNRTFRAGQISANDLTFVCRLVKSSVEANPGTFNTGSPTGASSGQPGI
jgi:hypothetical protein